VHWRPNNNIGVLNQLEVFTTGKDLPTYYVEHDKLFYDRIGSEKVTMKIVPAFSQYEDDDEVPVVSGYEGWVFDMVIQRYTQGFAKQNKIQEAN
jgi:poly-gamma-glutamate capsule biosynthesis protein CapA/YwtB (metallophosphatase superfamily)